MQQKTSGKEKALPLPDDQEEIMNISYEYYRIFYYAARYRNLTQAAEALHSNQPNVSRIIKILEHELGCTLFTRSNHGITLTPEGEQLYSHIKIAVEQIQTAEEELLRSAGLHQGTVTISTSETALHLVVLPVLNRFKKNFPDIRIRILNHLSFQAIEAVKTGLADFAVAAAHIEIEKPLLSCSVMEFKDILIGGPSYSHLKTKLLSLKELTGYPLVCLAENTMTHAFYSDFYRRHHLVLRPELEAATTDQLLPIIKNDLGIGFIPEVFAREALAAGEVCQIPLAEEIPARRIYFIENKNCPLNAAAKELKKLLLELPVFPISNFS